jgi:hypothetical protein
MRLTLACLGIALALGIAVGFSTTSATGQAAGQKGQTVPASLTDVGEFGENIYDLTKANDWTNAAEKLKALKEAAKKLGNDLKGVDLKRLNAVVTALDKAVPARDKAATLKESNQVTLIYSELVEPFNPQIPGAVTRLDHYGRELDIYVAAKDTGKLKTTTEFMQKTWDKLQPAVKAKGGEAEARKFTSLMDQLSAAKSVEDYGKLVTPILDEVDKLEQVFTAAKAPAKSAQPPAQAPAQKGEWQTEFGERKEDLTHTGRNTYFILEPGHYAVLVEGDEKLTVTVLNETKMVDGVETRVVEENETKGGKPVEVARNYYAISKKTNNIYYFGEDVDWCKDGKVVKHDGSWLAGVKGAKYGLMMPGTPVLKAKYYQEIAAGVALDRAEVISLNETVVTPAGTFKNCLKTEETSSLETNLKEYKLYAPGVGLVSDVSMKLVEHGFLNAKK